MPETIRAAGRLRRAWLAKVTAAAAVLCALGYLFVLYSVPWLAGRWIEREGAKFTGHPVRTTVEHAGLRGAAFGQTRFRYAGTDVVWRRLEFDYTLRGLWDGRLESVFLLEPELTVDVGAFEVWLHENVFVEPSAPDPVDEPEAPPPRPLEVAEAWVPPPLPHPAVLWETPLLLSRLREAPVGRAGVESGRFTAAYGGVADEMDFDLFFRRGEAGAEGFFRLKGPHLFQRFEATLPPTDDRATLRLAGSVVDGVEWLRSLFPPTVDVHPDRWLPAGAEARLPEILWEAAVETRGDLLERGGGLIEARDFTYGSEGFEGRFDSLVLGFQLGPDAVSHLSFGVNGLAARGTDWWFEPEQVSLFYSAATERAKVEIPKVSIGADGIGAAEVGLRLSLAPRAEWWTSPMEGEIGLRAVSAAGHVVDSFAVRLQNEETLLRGEVSPLRWDGYPNAVFLDTRFLVESPLGVSKEFEIATTAARAADSGLLAHAALRGHVQGGRIRGAWDLFGQDNEALGGGTLMRRHEDAAWEARWRLRLPGGFLGTWLEFLEPESLAGGFNGDLHISGAAEGTDAYDLTAEFTAEFEDFGFKFDETAVSGIHGGLSGTFSGSTGGALVEASAMRARVGEDLAFTGRARFDVTPRAVWSESVVEGEFGFESVVWQEASVDPFVLRVRHVEGKTEVTATDLRWHRFPAAALAATRIEARELFGERAALEASSTLARSDDRSAVARLAGTAVLKEGRTDGGWTLADRGGRALGGGSIKQSGEGAPWEVDWDLEFPGAVAGGLAALFGDALPVTDIAGLLRLRGRASATDGIDARAAVSAVFEDMSFLAAGTARFRGVSGGIAMQWVGLPAMESEQEVRAASVTAGDLVLRDLRLRVHWPLPHRFEIRELSMRVLGGTARLEPAVLNPLEEFGGDLTLIVEQIDAAAVAALFPDERYSVEGRLSGRIPVRYEGGRLLPLAGRLEMSPGTTARIRLLDPELRAQVLSGIADDPRLQVRRKLSEALEQGIPLNAYSIQLFDPASPDFPAVILASGGVRTADLRADSVSIRLNYALEGVDWRSGFGWILDLLEDFQP
ncbi:MAG: YdbH domain-containing protein [Opitutales bacterium]|nr:YdbH domain-containing protein [Opitutales bacterium]